MPSCKGILNRMVFKGAMTEKERDKILRNLKTEWIPVSERLPKDYGEYFVTIQYAVSKYKDVTTICYNNESKEWMDCEGFKVISWMPMPSVWEGGGEE